MFERIFGGKKPTPEEISEIDAMQDKERMVREEAKTKLPSEEQVADEVARMGVEANYPIVDPDGNGPDDGNIPEEDK